jgi:hypothetical protein
MGRLDVSIPESLSVKGVGRASRSRRSGGGDGGEDFGAFQCGDPNVVTATGVIHPNCYTTNLPFTQQTAKMP